MIVTPLEITMSRTLWVIDKTEILKSYKYILCLYALKF
jgi:hypothetical protein